MYLVRQEPVLEFCFLRQLKICETQSIDRGKTRSRLGYEGSRITYIFEGQKHLLKYLIPRFPLRDLPVMLAFAGLGSLIAGGYGILHDQITYSIGPEYFINFKFEQFQWANLRRGNTVFVSCIGFLATWWVGLVCGWILARRMLPNQDRRVAVRKVLIGFVIIFATGIAFGIGGYFYGNWRGPDGDYSAWTNVFDQLGVMDHWAFMRVAYIHNAGYLGGLVGLILTFLLLRKDQHGDDVTPYQ